MVIYVLSDPLLNQLGEHSMLLKVYDNVGIIQGQSHRFYYLTSLGFSQRKFMNIGDIHSSGYIDSGKWHCRQSI